MKELFDQVLGFLSSIYQALITAVLWVAHIFNPLTLGLVCIGLGLFALVVWQTGSIEAAKALISQVIAKLKGGTDDQHPE